MKRTLRPRSRSARTTSSVLMISRKLPMCTVPEGVMPEAATYSSLSPFSRITCSAYRSAQ